MQLKDCIAPTYSASSLRRYIPKAEFSCTVAQTIVEEEQAKVAAEVTADFSNASHEEYIRG
jgi:hypothetical protein